MSRANSMLPFTICRFLVHACRSPSALVALPGHHNCPATSCRRSRGTSTAPNSKPPQENPCWRWPNVKVQLQQRNLRVKQRPEARLHEVSGLTRIFILTTDTDPRHPLWHRKRSPRGADCMQEIRSCGNREGLQLACGRKGLFSCSGALEHRHRLHLHDAIFYGEIVRVDGIGVDSCGM